MNRIIDMYKYINRHFTFYKIIMLLKSLKSLPQCATYGTGKNTKTADIANFLQSPSDTIRADLRC